MSGYMASLRQIKYLMHILYLFKLALSHFNDVNKYFANPDLSSNTIKYKRWFTLLFNSSEAQIIMDNNSLLDVHITNHLEHDNENPLVSQENEANEANETNSQRIFEGTYNIRWDIINQNNLYFIIFVLQKMLSVICGIPIQ